MDARRVEQRDKFVSINPDVDYQGRVIDIEDHFGHLPPTFAFRSNG